MPSTGVTGSYREWGREGTSPLPCYVWASPGIRQLLTPPPPRPAVSRHPWLRTQARLAQKTLPKGVLMPEKTWRPFCELSWVDRYRCPGVIFTPSEPPTSGSVSSTGGRPCRSQGSQDPQPKHSTVRNHQMCGTGSTLHKQHHKPKTLRKCSGPPICTTWESRPSTGCRGAVPTSGVFGTLQTS